MDKDRIDELCGGKPKIIHHCDKCSRKVGPYYEYKEARAAMATHVAWRHSLGGFLWEGPINRRFT